ncbi:uncharacterized protein PV09_07058 [Verruconis gallopava]|uniref:CipC-like antibiotic response protein n=1 Tax=Verruconis gallopava TaxID=253628 RepID=A0A0D2A522_9PEZI|nr:uncharacterized protein PV09_07058 [Verruconis gallopava]KIW01585.1 hypothetical protein PV09_07058 [Verruconis gallopava]
MAYGWDESHDAYQNYQSAEPHEASFGHELLGGAAAFGAMKMFEDHQRKEGKTVNHAFAKELLAGFAGAEVDRLAETKGADFIDREKAKRHARESAERMYDDHYGRHDEYDPERHRPHERLRREYGEDRW